MDAPVEIWGEDALLQWPGARRSLIQNRDAYMARTIWAAATGAPVTIPSGLTILLPSYLGAPCFQDPLAAVSDVCLPFEL